MATISNIGIGSGLELGSLLEKLETAEKAPLKLLENQASSYQAKLSAYGTLSSVLSAYQAAAKKLADAATFSAAKAVVGSSAILSAAAASNAVPGTYSVNVTSLAQAQSLVGKNVASQTTAIGAGKITFEFGERQGYNEGTGGYTDPLGFTADATRSKTVEIKPGEDSLQSIRDAINKASVGVTASIVNDGSGTPYRLVLTSNSTGEKSSMRITADSPELTNLVGFDPTQATQTSGMQETVRATNAKLAINGINVASQTNTVTDAAQGVTLTLNNIGGSSLTVTRDTESIRAGIQNFVTAYNNIQNTAKTLTSFDATTGSSAALNGDSTLRSIQTRLRSMLNVPQPDGNGGTITLSEIGVAFTKDGTLTIDDGKLTKAINEDLGGITSMFSHTTGTGGFGKQITDAIDDLNETNGAIKVATDGLTDTLKDLEDRYTQVEDRVNATIDRYRAQFTQLDMLVSQLNQTSSYLNQQFAALANQTKK
ncbi:flagellar filament capping protein FliD [Cupriavidus cauae]|uniref:Flagellar hook-associated protein 2 n=1 Tax=Cupriavidus cauae TaxID=2608999 RepID=A0A5M8BDF5_9BURK|nr:flagellar filament capping protein FliD [Cupriavidus cauae]KAA6133092.1 flagellar filament capping protein FliD [Cupriavidus cauae]